MKYLILLPLLSLLVVSGLRAETFDLLDLDSNGVITISELRILAKDPARLEQAFNRIDEDGNGVLSRNELGIDGRRILGSADANRDGVLDREEFASFFQNSETEPALTTMEESEDAQLFRRHDYFKQKKETKAGVWLPLMKF